jgi:hypothetical protein
MVQLAAALAILAAVISCAPAVHSVPQRPAPVSEKAGRTPAQQKINSAILYEIYRRQGRDQAFGIPPGPTGVRVDAKGRALVDLRADVTPALEKTVRSLGATIVSTSPANRTVIAWIPLLKIERLAADPSVRAIEPKAEATIKFD